MKGPKIILFSFCHVCHECNSAQTALPDFAKLAVVEPLKVLLVLHIHWIFKTYIL
jgi:hypothetical protein